MLKNNFKLRAAACLAFALTLCSLAAAEPTISADLAAGHALVGDTATVNVSLSGNPGIHGLYFDLSYDASCLQFDGFEEGQLVQDVAAAGLDGQLLHAVSDPRTSAAGGAHLIASYSLNGQSGNFRNNGILAQVRFRVLKAPDGGAPLSFRFRTPTSGTYDGNRNLLAQTVLRNSANLAVANRNGYYVRFTAPLGNDVVYQDTASVSAISSAGTGYKYRIGNEDATYSTTSNSAALGSLNDLAVPMAFGLNRLKIDLLDAASNLLASDAILVYRAQDQSFVRIVNPADHALVNSDMVSVTAASIFDAVQINDQDATKLADKSEGKNLFTIKLWLKNGFNQITAKAVGPQGQRYTHSIYVYYQKDESVFRIVQPGPGIVIKANQNDRHLTGGSLRVTGEIGSTYQSPDRPNTVTLRVVFTPKDPNGKGKVLVQNRPVPITESSLDGGQAPYMFANNFDIPVASLDSGELEIIAYKNLSGTRCDAEVHQVVYLDRNQLAINLVQPNIYSNDVLDTPDRVKGFNRAVDPFKGDVVLEGDGTLTLQTSARSMQRAAAFDGMEVVSQIICRDGVRYVLVNDKHVMKLFRKPVESATWGDPVALRDDLYGYTLCETDLGILVGASNLFNTVNSGLYLYDWNGASGTLKNVRIGQPIPYVQFIANKNGTIYLYGNDYSHLYSFNLFSLEEADGTLNASVVGKVPFATDLFLRGFTLSDDAHTAILLSQDNKASVYQLNGQAGYARVSLETEKWNNDDRYAAVVKGEYRQGSYTTYLFLLQPDASGQVGARVLMENRETHRLVLIGSVDISRPGETLLGLGFAGDRFVFAHKTMVNGVWKYRVRKANVFFDQVSDDPEVLEFDGGGVEVSPVPKTDFALYGADGGNYTMAASRIGAGGTAVNGLFDFVSEFQPAGTVEFDYANPDLESLNGFNFQVDPHWLKTDKVQLGFAVLPEGGQGGQALFATPGFGLSQAFQGLDRFIEMTPEAAKAAGCPYAVTHSFDPETARENVQVTFAEPKTKAYIHFVWQLQSVGAQSAKVSNLSIQKKVIVKVPRNGDSTINLPIHGWIADPTVTEVRIQQDVVKLERNGYFSYNYLLKTTEPSTTIQLSCVNGAGEQAALSFSVRLFDSVNSISEVAITDLAGQALFTDQLNPSQASVDASKILVSARVFGLEGLVAGYETFGYSYDNGTESLKKISSGVFNVDWDAQLNAPDPGYGTGYVSGGFGQPGVAGLPINLLPGRQRIVVYVENPGGKRSEFKIDGKYPDVTYNLPENQQQILLLNSDIQTLSPSQTVSNVVVDKKVDLTVSEAPVAPYPFERKYTIGGRVNSLYRFTQLKVKSPNEAVTFDNGTQEMIIPVDDLNQFNVQITVRMPESDDQGSFPILFIPTAPFLEWMKTGVIVNTVKNFVGTHFYPNFAPMDLINWSDAEKAVYQKNVMVKIDRRVPEGTNLLLTVNYEKLLSGVLRPVDGQASTYRLLDTNGNPVALSGLKAGVNRIHWELTYQGMVVCSADGTDENMVDYFLTLPQSTGDDAAVVTFPADALKYYDNDVDDTDGAAALPDLTISKKTSMRATVYLNGVVVKQDAAAASVAVTRAMVAPIEGKNCYSVELVDSLGNASSRSFDFLYDTAEPVVRIVATTYNDSNTALERLSAVVSEANLKKVELFLNDTLANTISLVNSPCDIAGLGNNQFLVSWGNLGSLDPKLNPNKQHTLFARVTDHTGKAKDSPAFEGLGTAAKPTNPVPEKIDLAMPSLGGRLPTFPHETDNWNDGTFGERRKIFNSDITLVKIPDGDQSFTVQRPDIITVGELNGGAGLANGKSLSLQASTGVVLGRGFKAQKGAILNIPAPQTNSPSFVQPPVVSFIRPQATSEYSVSFWMRYEPESYYASDTGVYRRILTVARGTINEASSEATHYEIYLAYMDNVSATVGDETVSLLERRWSGADESKAKTSLIIDGDDKNLVLSHGKASKWHLITLGVNKLVTLEATTPVFTLSVNQAASVAAAYTGANDQAILNSANSNLFDQGTTDNFIYFGEQPARGNRNGHFSIAQPFFIAKNITNNDVYSLQPKLNDLFNTAPVYDGAYDRILQGSVWNYDFSGNVANYVDSAGDGYNNLRIIGDTSYLTSDVTPENANFSENNTTGITYRSLRATGKLPNRMTFKGQRYVFQDATSAVTDHLDANIDDRWMTLTPINMPLVAGRYAFGNTFGSHNLANNRWYSVYGSAAALTGQDIDADLVVSINGAEKRYPIPVGAFHFAYENPANEAPVNVVMYVEARSGLKLRDIFMTEGNFTLPPEAYAGLEPSYAVGSAIFQKTGTLDFWYKPLAENDDGFVDIPLTLFDSDFFTINTVADGAHQVYQLAVRRNVNGNLAIETINSGVPVRAGWHHLRVGWSLDGTADGFVAFYIDGQLVSQRLNPVASACPAYWSPSMYGVFNKWNVVIGANANTMQFANGYIDNFRLQNWYQDSLYEDREPLKVAYADGFTNNIPSPTLTINRNTPTSSTVSAMTLQLKDQNGKTVYLNESENIEQLGLSIKDYPAGGYTLSLNCLVNGTRYEKNLRFIKNDKPRFDLVQSTKLLVAGVPTSLHFDFAYDRSYLTERQSEKYAGIAVSVNNAGVWKTLYAVQDFRNFDHNDKWIVFGNNVANPNIPEELAVSNGIVSLSFDQVVATGSITWEYRPFYFSNSFVLPNGTDDPSNPASRHFPAEQDFTIGFAKLTAVPLSPVIGGTLGQYKLKVTLGTGGLSERDSTTDFTLKYLVKSLSTGATYASAVALAFTADGSVDLYYDDLCQTLGYGDFSCTLSLLFKGAGIYTTTVAIRREPMTAKLPPAVQEKRLNVNEFSILQLNRSATGTSANLYLGYEQNGFPLDGSTSLVYELYSIVTTAAGSESSGPLKTGALPMDKEFLLLSTVPLPAGDSQFRIIVKERITSGAVTVDGLVRKMDLPVTNRTNPPEVFFTNTVDSRIAYNNVKFSWIGYHAGIFKPDIEYSYNFDNKGWSANSNTWRSVEFFNLAEGYHNLRVRALYGPNNYSPEIAATFFVDVSRPSVDLSKVTVQKIYDDTGFLMNVNLAGAAGAVLDTSLSGVTVNGTPVGYKADGSFVANGIPIDIDGDNPIVVSAVDSVGNFCDRTITVSNPVTELLYPQDRSTVRFTPMTMVGRMTSHTNAPVDIYLKDPSSPRNGSYQSWRKARLNEDFTFFIDDVTVVPGSAERETMTPLEMAVVTGAGTVYTRKINLFAKEALRPIDLALSAHAVEGERNDTKVTITATANVPNISSWSIDFNGDGIYDDVRMTNSTPAFTSQQWDQTYSTLGLVKPRVRIITKDGAYFTASDELIIHESIKEAANKSIAHPVGLSALAMPDGSQRLYVLAGEKGSYRIEVYEVGRNEAYVSNRLYQVDLDGFGLGVPVQIDALDARTVLIGANKDGQGSVHTLKSDEFDVFTPVTESQLDFSDSIADLSHDKTRVFVSMLNTGTLWTADLAGGQPAAGSLKPNEAKLPGEMTLGGRPGLAKDSLGLLVADHFHQRLLRLSDGFASLEYMGGQGFGEGQFIKPSIVRAYQNRVFVSDEGRGDIQVFDPEFKLVTRLKYDDANPGLNYLDAQFLKGLVGVSAFARVEGERLFYYAVLLSSTSGKLAVLRLPQWEEMRARARNNKLIFLKDNEVYAAKPTGADLSRLISTDSIPRINGDVEYPALSPDGKMLSFTSRAMLFDANGGTGTGTTYAYDNLYVMNVDGSDLRRIPMSALQGYEIERPVFNSNGTKVIFSAKPTGGKWQIHVYDFATGGTARLFVSDENARFPYYSPDDRFIVFTTDYDGDEEIQIFDTLNPSMRVSVTSNRCRDSYPVWAVAYPGEIANPDFKIESKIAFVSERNFHKGVYYVYLSRPSESDIRVVNKIGEDIGNQPDAAAVEVTSVNLEGDYPCFTGDGSAVVFEQFDGTKTNLMRFDLTAKSASAIGMIDGARRPSGMKNTIAQFKAEVANGDNINLSWNRYTDSDVFYTVRFKVNRDGENFVEKRVFTQDHATLTGLEMGMEYLVRVSIVENDEEAAATQWVKLKMPEVVAKPTVTMDKNNPYLVHLNAWKPKPETDWGFSWIIDNQEIQVQSSQDYLYEFGTSGTKTIILKAHNKASTYTSVSDPVQVNIVSDIHPTVEYLLADDRSYVELSAQKSLGQKIDWASAVWTVTGPGLNPPQQLNGSKGIVNIGGFKNKINVSLKLSRVQVIGQPATDVRETNMVIDLDYRDTKLVITQEEDPQNRRLITFSGANSIGNVNWREAKWVVFRDGQSLHQATAVSSFAFEFPETGTAARYSVSLSVPRMSDGLTSTVSNIVSIGAVPIEPVIDYTVIDLVEKATNKVIGSKIVFSAGNSKGSNIDFAQAKWTVPVAGQYSEQPTQVGPTAVYNLINAPGGAQVEVSLTLMRRGGTEALTSTKIIVLRNKEQSKPELKVNCTTRTGGSGRILDLDVLSSTGPNIDWEKTNWQFSTSINGLAQNATQMGPNAHIEIPASAENTVVSYTVTLYQVGGTSPLVKRGELPVDAATIQPLISPVLIGGNVYNLSVAETTGVNIDWERTCWYIYDGADSVTQKYGAQITHAFVKQDKKMGYPVVAVMYFKGNAKPFYALKTVDIEADRLIPSIHWDAADTTAGAEILFDAIGSSGSGIDWSQAKWTFGDGSPSQYGAAVGHKYPITQADASYKVSLTLTRRLANGTSESATRYSSVTIGKDEMKPVVKAVLDKNGYLVLSAEESEGRGLFLDRSIWMFAGKGDNENTNISKQTGTTSSQGWNKDSSTTAGVSLSAGPEYFKLGISISGTNSNGTNGSDSTSDSLSSSTSFTNENYHTGMTARRWIGDYDIYSASYGQQRTITLSLSVYRQDADGGMVGKTITVNVNLADAAKAGGVTYR